MDIQTLENQLTELEQKKVTLHSQENADPVSVIRLDQQIDQARAQLSAAREQQQAFAQQHEVRMEIAQERINTAFDEVDFDGEKYPIRIFTKDESSAQVLRIHFTNVHLTQESENSERVQALKAGYEADSAQLKAELKESRELAQSLKEQLAQAIMEKEDVEQKRDAAVREVEDAVRAKNAAELLADEKQKHIDKLREEQAIGASAAVRIIKNTDGMDEAMQKWKQERPAIYDVQSTDPLKKVDFKAKYVETDEVVYDKFIYIGKYRVLEDDEASRFRQERDAAKALEQAAEPDTNVTADIPLVIPPFQFPEVPTIGLVEGQPSEDGEMVTRKEFEELKAEVAQIKQSVYRVA